MKVQSIENFTKHDRGVKKWGQAVFLTETKTASTSSGLEGETLEESDNLSDPDVLVLEIVVPRLASLWSEAVDRVGGSKTSKPPSNNSVESPLT